MAVIYPKTTDAGIENCVILNPAQALMYPFSFKDWTKLRVSMTLSYTDTVEPNKQLNAFGTPSIPAASEKDRLFYGIKKLGNSFPGDNNDVFLGLKSYGNATSVSFPDAGFDFGNAHGQKIGIGVHHPNQRYDGTIFSGGNAYSLNGPPNIFAFPAGFAGTICFYFEVIDKGLATQRLIVKSKTIQTTDTSKDALLIATTQAVLDDYGTVDFNNSGTPYDLPDSFFIYNPITAIRTRVFALTTIKEL